MSEPEFYASATLGFRQWYFSLANSGESSVLRGLANPLLHGLAKHGFNTSRYRWRVDGPNHAECARLKPNPDFLRESHGEVPGMDCSCGFYAYGRRIGSNSQTTIHLVGGVVAGWGASNCTREGSNAVSQRYSPSSSRTPKSSTPTTTGRHGGIGNFSAGYAPTTTA